MIEIAGGIVLAVVFLILAPIVAVLFITFGWVLLALAAVGLWIADLYVAAVICGIIAALWGGAMCASQ